MTNKDVLKDAQTLALFSNLTEDAEYFSRNYSDFVPFTWWTPAANVKLGKYLSWTPERDRLREAWEAGFPAGKTLELATSPLFLMARQADAEELENTPPKIWPYQEAVLFLHANPWRAKFCNNCGRRYVKEKPPQKFCSERCTREARKKGKRKLWKNHPEWLKNRKKPKKSGRR
jgi:hypothetical protein